MRRLAYLSLVVGLLLAVGGCGGDNLALCDGCSTPVPTLSVTPSATPATPTPAPTAT